MTLRARLANAVLILSVLCWGVLCLPLMLGPRRWSSWVIHQWASFYMHALRWVGGLDVEIRGTLPDAPVIVAAKHQSAWETFIFLALYKDSAYILKRELLSIPVYGWYVRRCGHVPIDRSGGASALKNLVAASKKVSEDGRPIIIFPQGTRVEVGEAASYQPGIAGLYKGLGVPVVPVGLNSGLFYSQKGLMQRGGTVEMVFGDPIPPGLDRKTFMARLEQSVEGLTDPLLPKNDS